MPPRRENTSVGQLFGARNRNDRLLTQLIATDFLDMLVPVSKAAQCLAELGAAWAWLSAWGHPHIGLEGVYPSDWQPHPRFPLMMRKEVNPICLSFSSSRGGLPAGQGDH
ncbi:hypothetical protein P4S72_24370 [Vibrio sp. PP-XX7]